jgi:hypothetical protein
MQSPAPKEPNAASSPAAAPPRWQFGLKDLFGLMTYAAAALGLVVWFGPGTLITSLGFLIAILNVRGAFARWQRGWVQWVLLVVAWVTFLISLALPCLSTFSILGWQAAWVYLVAPFERLFGGDEVPGSVWFWLVALDLSNILMAGLPIYLWRLSRERGEWFAAVLCVAMTGVWSLNWGMGFFVGYFVWCASFQVALVAIPLKWQTFLAMLANVALLAALNWWDLPLGF